MRNLLIPVIPAVIGVIAIIGNYQAAMAPVRLQIRSTQTAEARSTAITLSLSQTPPAVPQAAASPTREQAPQPMPATGTPESPALTLSLQPANTAAPGPTLTPTVPPTSSPTAIPITPLPFETLYYRCRDNGITHGNARLTVSPGCPGLERDSAVQIAWTVPDPSSYTGCTVPLAAIAADAVRGEALVFWARAVDAGEAISIKLIDATGEHAKQLSLSTGWQQVALSFLKDFPDLDTRQVQALTIGIDYNPALDARNGRGSACFSGFGFGIAK